MTRRPVDRYRLGRVDGLREAVAIVQALGLAIDERSPAKAKRTREARTVRRQAYRNAETRLSTALKRHCRRTRAALHDPLDLLA